MTPVCASFAASSFLFSQKNSSGFVKLLGSFLVALGYTFSSRTTAVAWLFRIASVFVFKKGAVFTAIRALEAMVL